MKGAQLTMLAHQSPPSLSPIRVPSEEHHPCMHACLRDYNAIMLIKLTLQSNYTIVLCRTIITLAQCFTVVVQSSLGTLAKRQIYYFMDRPLHHKLKLTILASVWFLVTCKVNAPSELAIHCIAIFFAYIATQLANNNVSMQYISCLPLLQPLNQIHSQNFICTM